MRITHLRRFSLAAVLTFALALFGLGQPASADTPDVAFSVDHATATPGTTVNLQMTFTNSQTTDVWFVYQSVQPTWQTTQRADLKYTLASCTGQGVTCTGTGTTTLGVSYSVPVAPGASRTVTIPVQIAATSGCNGDIAFYSYVYYEFNNSQSHKDGVFNSPTTRVNCATPAPAGAL
ncbi:hypothetical protein [Streptomyces sp. NBC_01431]|uniref:hypothetical protein n=1 Tax=Streptomyces sp. NBC_01431 TaxID=2903863 RepID=UPI002E2EFACB|nr:hypothetical protein [Streptomyces sp. NBC_01431]